ncbi:Coronin-2B [Hypsibius exemplaris]|uniref:Coronin n=1 Tax=Hypsibius exemplaris TaxID=2072580 RepID=A0A1W0WIC2_HYPEX|nr:Coronin-2B [Hypsibius exemplaris]
MSFRIRPSKFRHVYGEPAKKNLCYENIRISKNAHDTYFSCTNPKFLAVIIESAGGGAFQVLPLERFGRIDLDWGKVSGHSGPVLDIKFDPFNDNVIASASEDCTVKLWHIPDGGAREIRDSLVTLQGHTRRVVQIEWHPTAENILISAGSDSLVILWDCGAGEAIRIIDCHKDVVCSMGFSWTGNVFATTCRDLQIRLIEPRMAKLAQITPGHAGSKASKLAFLTNRKQLFTTGFSKYTDRQYAVWDINNLSQPLKMDILDSSSGVTFPYYDPDTSVVYLAGRGDGNIRYYEMVDSFPVLHYLSQYQSSAPQRSLCAMPKRGLNVNACEIFRFYKLYATKNYIEPISMIAPRKSGLFHEDLFPETAAPTPSMTTEDWLNGQNSPPVMTSLKTRDSLKTNKPVVYRAGDNQLITSDRNNELKFRFIADTAKVDYRPLSERKQNKGALTDDDVRGGFNRSSPEVLKRRSLAFEPSTDLNQRSIRSHPHRLSLQEEPTSHQSEQVDVAVTALPGAPPRKSFRKLQRMWSDRQHSLDVAVIPESPVINGGDEFSSFDILHETLESDQPDPLSNGQEPTTSALSDSSLMDVQTSNETKSVDSEISSGRSDERSDKENHDPDPSFPQIFKLFLEQKETIVKLERTLRLKDEENARLLAQIRLLQESAASTYDPREVSVDGPEIGMHEPCESARESVVNLDECETFGGTSES